MIEKILKNIDFFSQLSIKAGNAIMEVYNSDFEVITKSDNSPVTVADKRAEKIILKALYEKFKDIPAIAEEQKEKGDSPDIFSSKYFWLIDPLDGTKEFIKKSSEFTVNIALIENNLPVFGIIYVPVKKELFYGIKGHGAYKVDEKGNKKRIFANDYAKEPFRVLTNKSAPKVERFISNYRYKCLKPMSSSVKFCDMAEDKADIYARFAPTCEWDTAAGHAILKEAGGIVTDTKGFELTYGKQPYKNPFFIAFANKDLPNYFFSKNTTSESKIDEAVEIIKNGGLVAFPTETVYGLGADATNDKAVAKIYEAKKRPNFNPLIAHVCSKEQAQEFVEVNDKAKILMDNFWPGALTLVLKRKEKSSLSLLTSAGLDTSAVRMPNSVIALELIKKARKPIAAPSANLSSTVSPTRAFHVRDSLKDNVDLIINGGACKVGVESTVVHVDKKNVTLLRAGGIEVEKIEEVLGEKLIIPSEENPKTVRSPGQLKTHYAPSKEIRLNALEKKQDETLIGFGSSKIADYNLSEKGDLVEAASNLFFLLRKLDKDKDCKKIALAPIPFNGLGLAINDRLKRASIKN